MSPADAWLAGYVGLAVISAATIILRRDPTLVRGSLVFGATALYVAIAAAGLLWRGTPVPGRAIVAAAAVLVVSALLTPWWFVIGGPRTAVAEIIETCFGRVCGQYERTGAGFVMTVPGGALHVGLHPLGVDRLTAVSLRHRPKHKKGDLYRRLLIKQWRGPYPTIRIRMR